MSQRQNNQTPTGRKTKTMTNIIVKIEKANDKTHALIKNNAENLIELCNAVYAPKLEDMKQDEYRDWLFAEHRELAVYLYDTVGAKDKMKMSQQKKNIYGGIKTIATRNNDFLAWCASDFGSGTSSLAKVTGSVNGYEKSLAPKKEKTTPANGGGDGGDDTGETIAPIEQSPAPVSPAQIAEKLIADLGRDMAEKISIAIADALDAGIGTEQKKANAS